MRDGENRVLGQIPIAERNLLAGLLVLAISLSVVVTGRRAPDRVAFCVGFVGICIKYMCDKYLQDAAVKLYLRHPTNLYADNASGRPATMAMGGPDAVDNAIAWRLF